MFVFKILSGALTGAEVVVPAGVCFVRLIPPGADTAGIVVEGEQAEPKDTVLSIPANGEAHNFALTITPVGTLGASLSARVFDGIPGKAERDVPWNRPVTIGALRFAVKHHDIPWSDEVIHDRGPDIAVSVSSAKKWRYGLGAVATLLLVAASVSIWQGARAGPPATEVAQVLVGASWQVHDGRDGKTHVIADSPRAALAARQALEDRRFARPVRVHTRDAETAKIGALLQKAGAAYLSVNLADAVHPEIFLRETAAVPSINAPSHRDLEAAILAALPYAGAVEFLAIHPNDTLRAVHQRMAEVGVQADVGLTDDHLTISVNDHITDEQLVVLGQTIQELKSKWGPSFVQLIVAQQDLTTLHGVKTGSRGYELRGPSHVFFP